MLAWMIDSINAVSSVELSWVYPEHFDLETAIKQKRIEKYIDLYACGEDTSNCIEVCGIVVYSITPMYSRYPLSTLPEHIHSTILSYTKITCKTHKQPKEICFHPSYTRSLVS